MLSITIRTWLKYSVETKKKWLYPPGCEIAEDRYIHEDHLSVKINTPGEWFVYMPFSVW